ncbi:Cytochrome P450 [Quillaja saponaria]|uniref:Cytochrome P450 n=1 Tax=Quillaja saponaria TaxID=32244 RepID=A0AAD7LHM2_QUISA|nr:Cytochrome P450 [Quillaja saponaria]
MEMDFLTPSLNTITIGLISLFAISFFLFIWRSKLVNPKGKTPLVAAGAWPIIGHLPLLSGSKHPHVTLGVMADKSGPIFTIKIGVNPALVVSDWKITKECYTTNDEAVSSRHKQVVLGFNYAMFGFSPYGPYWREMRKISKLEFLSTRRIQLLSRVRVSEVETSTKELYKDWDQKNNWSCQFLVELKQWFSKLTLNVVLRMVCGKRCFGVKGAREVKEAERCLKAIRELIHLLGLFVASDAIPCIGLLDLGGHEKTMKKTARELDRILSQWLEEHRHTRASGVVVEDDQDLMDAMLSIFDSKELHGFDAHTIIKATVLSMIAGGNDTSAVTLIWSMSLLLNHHNVLKKAQEELDIQVGKDRFLNESDLNKLVYIQAIIKETLRLYPVSTGLRAS